MQQKRILICDDCETPVEVRVRARPHEFGRNTQGGEDEARCESCGREYSPEEIEVRLDRST